MNFFKKHFYNVCLYFVILITPFNLCTSQIVTDSIYNNALKKYVNTSILLDGKLTLSIGNDLSWGNTNAFNYSISSNLNTSLFGIKAPLNFSYSSGRTVYSYDLQTVKLPSFGRIGFSPQIGNHTFHLGYRQLQYSPYTLANYQFKGYGYEYDNEKYYLSAMYGDIKNANSVGNSNSLFFGPAFDRPAWSLKALRKKGKSSYGFIYFNTRDDKTSIPDYQNMFPRVSPKENAVISLVTDTRLSSSFFLTSEYAFSAFNTNADDPYLDIATQYTAYNHFELFTTRTTSVYASALKYALGYKDDRYQLSYNSELIGSNFRTLGSLLSRTNFVNNTVKVGTTFFDGAITSLVDVGNERMLSGFDPDSRPSRLILNTNLKYNVSDNVSISGKYSNFTTSEFQNRPSLTTPVDTVFVGQLKENIKLSSKIQTSENDFISISLGSSAGSLVDENLVSIRETRNYSFNSSYSQHTEKSNSQYNLNFFNTIDNNRSIKNLSLAYTLSKELENSQSYSVGGGVTYTYSSDITNILLNTLVSHQAVYAKKHNIRSSISLQAGRSSTLDKITPVFILSAKAEYTIGFRYEKTFQPF